jgi:hypothetical protein
MNVPANTDSSTIANRDKVDERLGKRNATVEDRRAALLHIAVRSDVNNPDGKAKKRGKPNTTTAPVAPVPEKTRRIVQIGVTFALLCAAALSAPTLYLFARLIEFPSALAWLLPACLDGYAGTSIWFGSRVAVDHPAHRSAKRNARLALAMTVGANGGYHLLILAGSMLPPWVRIVLLVVVSSLPPFIVDRLVHLNTLASGTADGTLDAAAADTQAPTKQRRPETPTAPRTADVIGATASGTPPTKVPPTTVAVADETADGTDTVIDFGAASAAARLNIADRAAAALPLYRQYVRANKVKPSAPQLAEILEREGHGTLGVSRARDVRKATEELYDANPNDPEAARKAI